METDGNEGKAGSRINISNGDSETIPRRGDSVISMKSADGDCDSSGGNNIDLTVDASAESIGASAVGSARGPGSPPFSNSLPNTPLAGGATRGFDVGSSLGSIQSFNSSGSAGDSNRSGARVRKLKPQLDMMDSLQVSMDISEILPHLFLGAKAVSEDWDALTGLGIGHIINCTTEDRNHFEDRGVAYLHVSVDDDPNSNIMPYFEQCGEFVESARQKQSKVLVHCTMGMSRSSTVVVAYLMRQNKMRLLEAMRFAKERRHMVSPNSGFMRQLCEFEKQLFGQASVDLEAYARDRFASVDSFALK